MSDLLHKITAEKSWVCKQGQLDVQLGTPFICTRVRAPGKHYYNKLHHNDVPTSYSIPPTGSKSG